MTKKLLSILKYLLSFGLAGLLVWLAFRGIDWHEFFVGLKATRWGWIVLYLIVGYLALVFRALRWTQLVHPLDNDLHYGKVWDANNIGGMASIALPGSGDLVRTALLTTAKLPYQTVFGTVMMERAWDILAILLMFVCSLVFAWGRFGGFFVDNIWHPLQTHVIILWGLAFIVLAIVVFIVLVRKLRDRSKFFGKLNDILEGFLTGFKTVIVAAFNIKVLYAVLHRKGDGIYRGPFPHGFAVILHRSQSQQGVTAGCPENRRIFKILFSLGKNRCFDSSFETHILS